MDQHNVIILNKNRIRKINLHKIKFKTQQRTKQANNTNWYFYVSHSIVLLLNEKKLKIIQSPEQKLLLLSASENLILP